MSLKHKSILVNNYGFFYLFQHMDKGVADLEMNSSIKLQRIKKSHKNCPVLSIKCAKHNYELVSGIKSKLLHGHF